MRHRADGVDPHRPLGREVFYWLTVLLTFALGTAAILVPWLLLRCAGLNAIAAFWASYVLTRPLGASLAGWLGMGKPLGVGVGFGATAVLAAP
ncbi:hypothetical protein ACFZDK_18985 [Streptomyces sp. NPDC007901]|uniref:hypothetical protein n=1 Tax=Streptomyces sp. NPDC007901 TaxID=3364785 RepID=UPI0036ECFFB6